MKAFLRHLSRQGQRVRFAHSCPIASGSAARKTWPCISAEDAINFGCTGPVLRGSGVAYDVRKYEPYGVYDKVDWEVPIGKNGDTYDRYWIRMEEMRQSARIIAQCLDQTAGGTDHGGRAATYSAAQGLGHAGHGKPDSPFHYLHPGHQAAEGRDLLRDRSCPKANWAFSSSATAALVPTD